MQAAPVRATQVRTTATSATQVRTTATPVRATPIPSVADALRAVESLLMSGGQRTARRNAWTSVLEDRRRAKDRVEALRVLEEAGTATRTS